MPITPRRVSAILWIVNLSSIAASVFSYVYLSYFVYERTGSVLYSEIVLLAPMVIPVVLCFAINRVASSRSPRQLLTATNAAGVIMALLTYYWITDYVYVSVVGALLIGFLDATQRVARTVAIKRYFSTADLKYAIPLTLTAQFIAGGIAGVGLAFFKSKVTPHVASTLVTGAFLVATIAAVLLPRLVATAPSTAAPVEQRNALSRMTQVLREHSMLRRHFWTYVIFVSVFQGFFNVSRVSLPTHQLNLPQTFVGYLQIISAMSALLGALLFLGLAKRKVALGRAAVLLLSLLSLGSMIGATGVTSVAVSYSLYFIYMCSWEVLFFKYQADVVSITPQEHMPLVATFQYAAVYLGMIVTALLGGLVTQYAGLTVAAVVFALIYIALMSCQSWVRREDGAIDAEPT